MRDARISHFVSLSLTGKFISLCEIIRYRTVRTYKKRRARKRSSRKKQCKTATVSVASANGVADDMQQMQQFLIAIIANAFL